MRALAVVALASSFATFVGCATAPPPEKMNELRARDFVPLAVGNKWEYRISAAPPDAPPEPIAIVEKDSQGYFVDSKGRKLAPRTDGVFDGERFLLQEPIEEGHEWIAVPKDAPDAVERYKIIAVGTMTKVPAGTFQGCVEVELVQSVRHATSGQRATVTTTFVYAPSVGLVKTFSTFAPENAAAMSSPAVELVSYDVKPAG